MKNTTSCSSKQNIFMLGKESCHGFKWGKLQRQISEGLKATHCTCNECILLLTRRLQGPLIIVTKTLMQTLYMYFFGNIIGSVLGQSIVCNTNWWMIIWGYNYIHWPKLTNTHVFCSQRNRNKQNSKRHTMWRSYDMVILLHTVIMLRRDPNYVLFTYVHIIFCLDFASWSR